MSKKKENQIPRDAVLWGIGDMSTELESYSGYLIPHGHGKITYPDGTFYTGVFENGLPVKNGTLHHSSGVIIFGVWTHSGREFKVLSEERKENSNE
jgi:hypothetical protein